MTVTVRVVTPVGNGTLNDDDPTPELVVIAGAGSVGLPEPVVVKLKVLSPPTLVLTIVTWASRTFVYVHVMSAPATSVADTVRVATLVVIDEPGALVPAVTHVRSVSWNTALAASVTVNVPGIRLANTWLCEGVEGGLGLRLNVAGVSPPVVV